MKYIDLERSYLGYQKASCKKSSFDTLRSRIRTHLTPFFKDDELPIGTQRQIEFKAYLADKQIKQSYKRTIFVCFAQMMNYGRRYLELDTSAKIPNFKRTANPIYTIWTFKQYKAFREKLEAKDYKAFFDLLYFGGLRRGEALALTPSDLESDYRIRIDKTYTRREVTAPKTPTSQRLVELPTEVYGELRSIAEKRDTKERLFKELKYTTIKRHMDKASDEASLPRARVHDLRHSHITMLLYEGITPQGIAHRVGHSNTDTLLNVYAGYLPREEKTICRKLENEIKKARL